MKERTMPHYAEWLPSTRTGQLEMCRNWIGILTAEQRTAWGIPADKFNALGAAGERAYSVRRDTPTKVLSAYTEDINKFKGGETRRGVIDNEETYIFFGNVGIGADIWIGSGRVRPRYNP
jgi:hypothetical protein